MRRSLKSTEAIGESPTKKNTTEQLVYSQKSLTNVLSQNLFKKFYRCHSVVFVKFSLHQFFGMSGFRG
jgi:hypothetical protein